MKKGPISIGILKAFIECKVKKNPMAGKHEFGEEWKGTKPRSLRWFLCWIWHWMLQYNPGLSPIVSPAMSPWQTTRYHFAWIGPLSAWIPPATVGVEVSAQGGMSSPFTAQHLCESGVSWKWERVWIALAGKVWVGEVNLVWVVGWLSN